MNQKTVFTVFAILGLVFSAFAYFFGELIAQSSFPELNDLGLFAVGINQELIAMINLILVLVMFATRNNPEVLWAFTVGFFLLGLNSLKHLLVDGVDVPIPGMLIQWIFACTCGYLWFKQRTRMTAAVH